MSDLITSPIVDNHGHNGEITLAEHAEAIRVLGRRVIGDVIEIGHRLTISKKICGHNHWLPWLEREFGWSEDSALRFMQVAEFSKSRNLRNLEIPVSGLYLLAAPSTPEAARDEVVERAEAGERMTAAQIKEAVDKAVNAEIELQLKALRAEAFQREAELRAEYEGAGQAKIDKAVTKATAPLQKKIEKYEDKLAKIAEREAARAEREAKQPKPSKKNGGGTSPPSLEPSAEFLRKFTFGNCLEAIFKQIEGLAVEQVVEVGQLGDLPRQAAVVAEWLERFVTVASGGAPATTETKIDPSKLN